MKHKPIVRNFYDRDVIDVARQLLGKLIVRKTGDAALVGRIVETEAYLAEGDSACHSTRGPTRKNSSMFGPPGHAYVYAIHAKYCFNIVTQAENIASAVLVRAIEPIFGIDEMRVRRSKSAGRNIADRDLTNGPAKLCQAMGIDRQADGLDLVASDSFFVADDRFVVGRSRIGCSRRIGVTSAHELELRYYIRNHPCVSGPKRLRQ